MVLSYSRVRGRYLILGVSLDVVCWSLARDSRAAGPEEQVDGLLLGGQG